MLRRGGKPQPHKNPTKRTKGWSLLLIPAVLERKLLLAPSAGVTQPLEHAGTQPEAPLLFQNFLKHLLELNLRLNPTGSLKTNKISLPLSFLTWERCVHLLSTSLCKTNRGSKGKCWFVISPPTFSGEWNLLFLCTPRAAPEWFQIHSWSRELWFRNTEVGKVLLFYKFIIYLLRWLLLSWKCCLWCRWVPQR